MGVSMDVNDATVAILREAVDNAADRVIAKREHPEGIKDKCPACGRSPKAFTTGQVYAAMTFSLFFLVFIVGAISK